MSSNGKENKQKQEDLENKDSQETIEKQEQPAAENQENEQVAGTDAKEEKNEERKDETALIIEKLTAEKAEYLQIAQYLQADFENYKKRSQKIISESLDEGKRETVKAILPVADNLQRCVDGASNDNPFVQGVQKTLRQLNDILTGLGVEEIAALGEPFDPNFHEAVMQEKVEGEKGGKVIEVLQKGYRINGKVLRHSMVKVSV